ncbi:MAG TPA: EscU/YscU/HrcU family type III secretion system export apparatus switch protein, partial [Planctomycetota bacterium]|nr:EscU/YscU/HrcU family type III secretion system export apparatus switch protein [Planctomycetota bacterium]
RRLEQASAKGQVAYSKDAGAAMLLLTVVGALHLGGDDLVAGLRGAFRTALALEGWVNVADGGLGEIVRRAAVPALIPAGVLLGLAFAAALAVGLAQNGVSVNFERLQLRWERVDPTKGFGKLFNKRSLMTLVVSAAKVAIVARVAWSAVAESAAAFAAAPVVSVGVAASVLGAAALKLCLRVAMFLAALALFDVFWQRFSHKKSLMMSKQEVKDEHKQQEGDGRVKSEIKRRMKQMARQRMMRDVRTATVVIRNPTHFAVALRYERGKDSAPRVVAKGKDFLALRILAEAEKHKVPCVARPELARELYRAVKLGAFIPAGLFKAVAAVLAYVLSKRRVAA